ncbi:MAG: hypothetical protein IKW49_03905, partial [Opitutales bacterium]|nr:hypothetical protein [Opitutales bacterium]
CLCVSARVSDNFSHGGTEPHVRFAVRFQILSVGGFENGSVSFASFDAPCLCVSARVSDNFFTEDGSRDTKKNGLSAESPFFEKD